MSWLKKLGISVTEVESIEDTRDLVTNEEGPEGREEVIEETDITIIEEITISNVTTSQVLTSFAASLGTLVVGYCVAYTSPALVSMAQNETYFPVSSDEASWIGSLMPLLALPGGFAGGSLIDRIGRKAAIELTAVPFATAGMLIAFAPNIGLIYFGRMLQGFAVGIISVAIPIYLAETSHNSVRGMLAIIPATFGNLGILICYTAGTFLSWRILSVISSILGVMFFLFAHFLPKSPHWLITKGRRQEAHEILTSLRRKQFNVHEEITSIEVSAQTEDPQTCDFLSFIEPQNLKALSVAVTLMIIQQLCGINAVIFYSASIFQDAGTHLDENICSLIVGIINLVASVCATFLIDRLGRRPLLITSCLIMCISLMSLGGFLYLKGVDPETITKFGWIPLVLLVLIVAGFSLGLGPVPWLIMSEIFSTEIRATASALATAFNWLCVFIVTKTFPILVEEVGSYVMFLVFAVVCALGTIFVAMAVPETKGKTLEEIQRELNPDTYRSDIGEQTDNEISVRAEVVSSENMGPS